MHAHLISACDQVGMGCHEEDVNEKIV